jgi:hypothetical protein
MASPVDKGTIDKMVRAGTAKVVDPPLVYQEIALPEQGDAPLDEEFEKMLTADPAPAPKPSDEEDAKPAGTYSTKDMRAAPTPAPKPKPRPRKKTAPRATPRT